MALWGRCEARNTLQNILPPNLGGWGGLLPVMHPFLLCLENAIKGAFLGGVYSILGVAIVSQWIMPTQLDTKQSVLLAEVYVVSGLLGTVAGLVTSLLLTRRALRRTK